MEANAEIRKYEETLDHLFNLLKTVCQERDEARDQLQLLQRNLHPSSTAETSNLTQFVDHPHLPTALQYEAKPSIESIKELDSCAYELSLSSLQHPPNEKLSSSNLALPKYENRTRTSTTKGEIGFSRDKLVDSASLVIDNLVWGKPLPQKGNLLRTVTEAGPLLQTLLIDPLPQWRNPPPLSSYCLPPKRTLGSESSAATFDDKNSVILTSLSLAVPGNSNEASMPFKQGSGLPPVNNKLITCLDNDSDMMHNHILTGKKRKLM
ncbi:hypothetical protein SESBI_17043 [Sesbania bispinosa]|nr:hypothetical protein SESBI_17043 [Sesbania bispinosa]